jgi:cell division protein FtsB
MNPAVKFIAFSALFLLLGAYGYFTLSGPQGIPALMEKRREIRALEEENANIKRENDLKRERIRKLTESVSEQDLEIRKKLKLLHENETEFILPPQPPTVQPTASN